jgi:hypothetical protein
MDIFPVHPKSFGDIVEFKEFQGLLQQLGVRSDELGVSTANF